VWVDHPGGSTLEGEAKQLVGAVMGVGRWDSFVLLVEEVHERYVTMLNRLGKRSMGKYVRGRNVVDYREEIRDPVLNRSRSIQVTFQSICKPFLETSGCDVRKF
jgi:hypothetical protein